MHARVDAAASLGLLLLNVIQGSLASWRDSVEGKQPTGGSGIKGSVEVGAPYAILHSDGGAAARRQDIMAEAWRHLAARNRRGNNYGMFRSWQRVSCAQSSPESTGPMVI